MVQNGKRDKLKTQLAKAVESGDWTIEIVRQRKTRSENQNDFYWGPFLDTLCDYIGETIPEMDERSRKEAKDQVHETLKARFLKVSEKSKMVRNPKNRRQYIRLKEKTTTTTLTTEDFERYLEAIRVYF